MIRILGCGHWNLAFAAVFWEVKVISFLVSFFSKKLLQEGPPLSIQLCHHLVVVVVHIDEQISMSASMLLSIMISLPLYNLSIGSVLLEQDLFHPQQCPQHLLWQLVVRSSISKNLTCLCIFLFCHSLEVWGLKP